jgi:hypothetical protein
MSNNNPKETNDFINDVAKAWEEIAKDAVLAEMTLAQFKNKVKASLDYRAEIESLERQLNAARYNRDLADVVSNAECLLVVGGVKTHREHGENSALYKAIGYVPKDERKNGLVRPSTNDQPTSKAA